MAEDGPQSRVCVVNAESITVEGDIDQVRKTLETWRGGFAPLKREADRVYVDPQHVTHIEDALVKPARR
jgi:hypothetical protein